MKTCLLAWPLFNWLLLFDLASWWTKKNEFLLLCSTYWLVKLVAFVSHISFASSLTTPPNVVLNCFFFWPENTLVRLLSISTKPQTIYESYFNILLQKSTIMSHQYCTNSFYKSIFGIQFFIFLNSWCKFLSKNVDFVRDAGFPLFFNCQDPRVVLMLYKHVESINPAPNLRNTMKCKRLVG